MCAGKPWSRATLLNALSVIISQVKKVLEPLEVEKYLKSCFSEPTETFEISEFWSVFEAFFNFKWL